MRLRIKQGSYCACEVGGTDSSQHQRCLPRYGLHPSEEVFPKRGAQSRCGSRGGSWRAPRQQVQDWWRGNRLIQRKDMQSKCLMQDGRCSLANLARIGANLHCLNEGSESGETNRWKRRGERVVHTVLVPIPFL